MMASDQIITHFTSNKTSVNTNDDLIETRCLLVLVFIQNCSL